jgi:hypothetical protein
MTEGNCRADIILAKLMGMFMGWNSTTNPGMTLGGIPVLFAGQYFAENRLKWVFRRLLLHYGCMRVGHKSAVASWTTVLFPHAGTLDL